MSEKYWSSRKLHFQIGNSRVHLCVIYLLGLTIVAVLGLLAQRGYVLVSVLLMPPAALSLHRLAGSSLQGHGLYWRENNWFLQRGDEVVPIELQAESTCLPVVLCLVWREKYPGRTQAAWIFHDALDRESLRRLRVLITLQR